ncbi:MAG: hypothetical protein E3K37_12125 [Candidatus Kuenenia sp.]|nr:hypothetical protein [Candidatus Kuenenia hertensis]
MDSNFKEFLSLLNTHKVKYVIVGAYALGCYTEPRFTNDLDIYTQPDINNVKKLAYALTDFGFDVSQMDFSLFLSGDEILRVGTPPLRIDILPKITGITWDEVWKNKKTGSIGTNHPIRVNFIGKKQLIKNKKATKRPKDLRDVQQLEDEE